MKRLLLIDDDIYAMRLYVKALQKNSFDVVSVDSVEAALKAVASATFDVIVLDVMMPPGEKLDQLSTQGGFQTGIQLIAPIKKLNPGAKLVALTNALDPDAESWFNTFGAAYYQKQATLPHLFAEKMNQLASGKTAKLRAFIVHGHDKQLLLELKNYLQNKLGFDEPIVLSEKPSGNRTIIEKFEEHAQHIDCAFVLFSPDDLDSKSGQSRARQNVIFELGYFLGVLGRRSGRVFVLKKGHLEIPSDLQGVIYIDVTNGIESAGETIRTELGTLLSVTT